MPSLTDIFNKMIGPLLSQPEAGSTLVEPEMDEDPYGDPKGLSNRVLEYITDCSKMRWHFERMWFKSILYYLGNQWIRWDPSIRKWTEKNLSRKWVPKPVTNRYASTVDTIVSAIQATKVLPTAWPATEDPEDMGSANVADRVLEVISKEMKSERVRKYLAKWLVLCGDAFAYVHYDKEDKTIGMTRINNVQCPDCGATGQPMNFEQACPECGSTNPPMESSTFEEYPIGKMCCDVLSPLEVYLNMDIVDMSKQTRMVVARSFAKNTVIQMYGEKAKNISTDATAATQTANYFINALAYATEDGTNSNTGSSDRDRVTLYTYIELPCPEYPEGLEIVMAADETILEHGPSSHYEDVPNGRRVYYLPLVKFGYEEVPGRLYCKTPAHDLIPKQDQLNRIESLIEMSTMKGVYGTWLLPTGSSIQNVTGEPGHVVRYSPTGTGGFKPEIVTTNPFPAIILQWKELIHADFEELGGTFDALKGNVPRGVSAGYAIQLLTERSYGRFASVFASWEESWVDLLQMSLSMFRTYATEPRLRKIKGNYGGWEIQAFKNTDLKGSVDLRVEGGASKPRSKLAEQALVETLAKLGFINPEDPEQRFQVTQMFGMGSILGANDEDVRHACGEWEALLAWEPPVDPNTNQLVIEPGQVFPPGGPEVDEVFDNHMIHAQEHRKPTRSDIWKSLPQWKRLYWKQHQITHMIAMQPVIDPMAAKQKKSKDGKLKDGDIPEGKGEEVGDQTMNQIREGGSNTYGSGGDNQYA